MKNTFQIVAIGLMVLGAATSSLAGQGGKGGKKKAPEVAAAPAVQAPADGESTFVGTLVEETRKNDAGKEIKTYTLTTAEGEKVVIGAKAAKGINVAELLNQKVKVIGKGEKKGKRTMLGSVTSITKAE